MKIKFDFIKFLISLFIIFVIFVVLIQTYNYLYKAAATEYAVEISCEDTIGVTGYFVRNEKVISSNNYKYIDLVLSNGNKVAKNGIIANVYSTENAAKIQTQIRDLQLKINELETVISAASKYHEENSYSSDIKKTAIRLAGDVSSKNYSQAFENASEFMTNVVKDKIASGEIIDYSDNLKKLEDEMKILKQQSSSVTNYIRTPSSGYFCYKVDGCEDKLNMDTFKEFDSKKFEQIKDICENETVDSTTNSIGKVVIGSEWKLCFEIDADKIEKVSVGSTMKIRIPSVTNDIIKCKVSQLVIENDTAYVVLLSNMVTGDLISQRISEIDIIMNSYEGLRVDKNALRKIDGKNGVFVRSNGILKYREVEILYIGSTFAVIKYDPINESGVQVYDEVVIKGTDLYDGKVI